MLEWMKESKFGLLIFRNMYQFRLITIVGTDIGNEAVFELRRSPFPLEQLSPEQAEQIPTLLQIYEIFEKTYMLEFLMSLAVPGFYQIGSKNVKIIAVPDKDTAYMQITATFVPDAPFPPIDEFETKSEVYSSMVSYKLGKNMFVERWFQSYETAPFKFARISGTFDSTLFTRKFLGFSDRFFDYPIYYYDFIHPMIEGMISEYLKTDCTKLENGYSEYMKFGVTCRSFYSPEHLHTIVGIRPIESLGHDIRWDNNSIDRLQIGVFDNQDTQQLNPFHQGDYAQIINTAWQRFLPMTYPRFLGQMQQGKVLASVYTTATTEMPYYGKPQKCENFIYTVANYDSAKQSLPVLQSYDMLPDFRYQAKIYDGETEKVYTTLIRAMRFVHNGINVAFNFSFGDNNKVVGALECFFDEELGVTQFRDPLISSIDKSMLEPRIAREICTSMRIKYHQNINIRLYPITVLPKYRRYLICTDEIDKPQYHSNTPVSESTKPKKDIIDKSDVSSTYTLPKKTGFLKKLFGE